MIGARPPAGHNLPFSLHYIVISPLPAGPLTAKVLMHTLPRSVILRASAQVRCCCCCHFVNLSPRQRRLEQSGSRGLMERQVTLCSRVTLWRLSIHHSRECWRAQGQPGKHLICQSDTAITANTLPYCHNHTTLSISTAEQGASHQSLRSTRSKLKDIFFFFIQDTVVIKALFFSRNGLSEVLLLELETSSKL